MKRRKLYAYKAQKGAIVTKSQKKKFNYAIFGVVGVAIVLILLVTADKKQNSKLRVSPTSSTTKVTVENEFAPQNSGNKPPPTLNSNSNSTNIVGSKFTFSVTSPTSGTTVKSSAIQVIGKTVPNADIFINELDTRADNNGNFSVAYTLEEGENYLVVGANDDAGNYLEADVTVTYEP